MLFFNIIFFSVFLLFSAINAMEDRLPADMIRQIAKLGINAHNWSDTQKAFALQSMAGVNKRWFKAMEGLKSQDFPYLPF